MALLDDITLFDRLEALFLQAEKSSGLKKHRILLDAGIDPAQYRAYKRAARALSDDMLERLGSSPYVDATVTRLRAWKAIDEFGADVLREALEVLSQEGDSAKSKQE